MSLDFSTILPSTDNLYKFLFSGGIILVVLSLVYPTQKKHQIELEINSHNQKVSLIENKANDLTKKIKLLSKIVSKKEKYLEELKSDTTTGNSKLIKEIKGNIKTKFKSLKEQKLKLEVELIINKHNSERINILKTHIKSYDLYAKWFLILGIPFVLVGLIGWVYQTILYNKKLKKEIKTPSNEKGD